MIWVHERHEMTRKFSVSERVHEPRHFFVSFVFFVDPS